MNGLTGALGAGLHPPLKNGFFPKKSLLVEVWNGFRFTSGALLSSVTETNSFSFATSLDLKILNQCGKSE